MRSLFSTACLALLVGGGVGCSETTLNVDEDPEPVPRPGSISGRACAATGASWLADGLVYTNVTDANGKVVDVRQSYTDRDGYWTLPDLAPNAEYTVYVQAGSDIIFTETFLVRDNQDIIVPEPVCFDPQAMNIAVVAGDYDNMQRLLNQMGFINFTIIDGTNFDELKGFLTRPENLEPFDVIFLNGGHVEQGIFYSEDVTDRTPEIVSVLLEEYVWNGGSIVASDWAYDDIELVWPGAIDFLGDDSVPNSAQLGEYSNFQAVVTDSTLEGFVGGPSVNIEYDLPVWPPMLEVEDYVSVHLRGDVSYREGTESYVLEDVPLLVSFSGGQGRVAFSTFRVAANQSEEMALIYQYIMYNVSN